MGRESLVMQIEQIHDKPQGGERIHENTDEFPGYGKGDERGVSSPGNKAGSKEEEVEEKGFT
jgi:hypothetical protein